MLAKIWHLRIVLIIAIISDWTVGDFFDECENKVQTYVAIKEDCSSFIFCHGEDSFSGSCDGDNPYFSLEEQTCDTNETVCHDRIIIKEASSAVTATSSPDLPITEPTTTTHSDFFTSKGSTVASPSTASSSSATVTTVLPSPAVPSVCPLVDDPHKAIFLPHKKSCSEYFLCYQGQRLPMRCSNMLHFDVRQQKCDYPENVKCHMMDVASPREQCLPHTFDVYPHPFNCNYYYHCAFGYLKVMQCPLNMGWHYEQRVCLRRSQAKCYSSFARVISQ